MDREFIHEWYGLRERALALIRAGAEGTGLGERVAQFVILPSFEPSESLDIVEQRIRGQAPSYSLVRTVWPIAQDYAKVESPVARLAQPRPLVPTIETDIRPSTKELVDEIRTALGRIVVPFPVKPANVGCDGVFYELRVGSDFTAMALKWWSHTPAGWEELDTAFHRIVADLRKTFV
jgi:hypothetical protein